MRVLLGYDNAKNRDRLAKLGIRYEVVFEEGLGRIYISEADAIIYLGAA